MSKKLSLCMIVKNEEKYLTDCFSSVQDVVDEIVLVDTGSTDQTLVIAEAFSAKIFQFDWVNDFAAARNFALSKCSGDLILYLDADERMTSELKEEVLAIARNPQEPHVAYYCGRRNFFLGRWIRHAMPPGNIMRFFRPSKIRFERLVNPTSVTDGSYGYLMHYFDHYNFSKGLTEWFDKHNKYSLLEAIEGMKIVSSDLPWLSASVLSLDGPQRRRVLKNWSLHMPFRPVLKFTYLYFIHRGFLDGRPGFIYCILQSIYEYMIVIKMRELGRREKGLPV